MPRSATSNRTITMLGVVGVGWGVGGMRHCTRQNAYAEPRRSSDGVGSERCSRNVIGWWGKPFHNTCILCTNKARPRPCQHPAGHLECPSRLLGHRPFSTRNFPKWVRADHTDLRQKRPRNFLNPDRTGSKITSTSPHTIAVLPPTAQNVCGRCRGLK